MKREILASGFSRFLKHMNEEVCAFISACRSDRDPNPIKNAELNNKLTEDLQKDIRASGLSYIKAKGHFLEDNTSTGETTPVEEYTFCVINNKFHNDQFIALCCDWVKTYGQESVLITFPPDKSATGYDTDIKGAYYDANGNIVARAQNVTLYDVADYFTHVGGKDFAMEYIPSSIVITATANRSGFVNSLAADTEFKNKYPELHKAVRHKRRHP